GDKGSSQESSNGFLKVGVNSVGVRAMSLPDGMPLGRGNNEVGVIGRREVDQFLPVRFVGIERHETSSLLSGQAFAYAVNNQRANQGRSTLEDGQAEISDTGVVMIIGGDFLAPNFAQFAALLREAENENQQLLAA